MEPVRRAVIQITFETLEAALGLENGMIRIVEILPKHPMTYQARLCDLVIEGPVCPIVREGERYQTRELLVHDLPDGSHEAELT